MTARAELSFQPANFMIRDQSDMADIINLRQARKAAERKRQQQQAAANRAHFGQTRSAKAAIRSEAERMLRSLDGARRDGAEAGHAGADAATPDNVDENS